MAKHMSVWHLLWPNAWRYIPRGGSYESTLYTHLGCRLGISYFVYVYESTLYALGLQNRYSERIPHHAREAVLLVSASRLAFNLP